MPARQPVLRFEDSPLGIGNPYRSHGAARTAYGLALLLLVGVAFLRGFDPPGRYVPFLVAGGIVALALLADGLRTWLQPLYVPPGAPGPLLHLQQGQSLHQVLETLRGRDSTYLGTYRAPTRLAALLVYHLFPRFIYMTPPRRAVLVSVVYWLAVFLLTCVLAAALLGPLAWLTGVLLLAGVLAQVQAARCCVPDHPRQPEVRRLTGRLTQAGQPQALFVHLRSSTLDSLREKDFPSRVSETSSDMGSYASRDSFHCEIGVETQPLPIDGGPDWAGSARTLEAAAVLLGVVGWGLWLFSGPDPDQLGYYLLAGAAGVLGGWRMLRLAWSLRSTYRFRSDLFWVHVEGTFQRQQVSSHTLGIGAVDRVNSDLHYEVLGTRLVTEAVGLMEPRYPVDIVLDETFEGRLATLHAGLCQFRDTGGQVQGIDLTSAGAQQLLQATAQAHLQQQLINRAVTGVSAQDALQMLGQVSPAQSPGLLPAPAAPPPPAPPAPPAGTGIPSAGPAQPPASRTRPGAQDPDLCPGCGFRCPGAPGRRRECPVCDTVF